MPLRRGVVPVVICGALQLVLTRAGEGQLPAQAARARFLQQSDIVFTGTVVQAGASALKTLPPSPNTVLVTVNEILERPKSVGLAPGDTVTVQVRDAAPFRTGVQATFYTQGWIFAESIAVREVGHEMVAAAAAPKVQQESVLQLRQQAQEEQLRARIAAADRVLVGRVVSTQPATMAAFQAVRPPITEHDPDWQEAVIAVEATLKGELTERVVVRFPRSMDVAWYGAPRFSEGQEGTFILQVDEVTGTPRAMLAGAPVTSFTALDQLDVLSKADSARVRALLRR